jgi:cell division protease FtsH
MRKIPIGQDVNPGVIARGTPGMSGADLANLCNEAALMAARRNARVVEMQDFEKAKDKILMGPERKSMVMPEEERRNTAYHESGHALIGKLLPKVRPCAQSHHHSTRTRLGCHHEPARERPLQLRQ